MVVLGSLKAQVTTPLNIANANTDFVGWENDPANQFELNIKHEMNFPIQWWTDDIRCMWLTPTLTALTVNGYTGLDLSGRLGIGDFNAPVNQPLTLLHLDSMGTELAGYRPWMGTGVLITKTSDMMYVGMMGGEDDRSDAIISWSDNVEDQPNFGPDRLRFIFTNEPPATPIMTAQELHGLELARIIPDPNGDEGYFGIGDWNTAGVEPDERLDVLDRTVRIR